MLQKTDFDQDLSDIGAKLLDDPISDVTRKRQTLLLIVSTLLILISFELITITDSSMIGMNFTITQDEFIKWFFMGLNLFCVVVFTLGAFSDYQIRAYILLPDYQKLMDLTSKLSKEYVEEKEYLDEVVQEVKVIGRMRRKKWEQLRQMNEGSPEYFDKFNELMFERKNDGYDELNSEASRIAFNGELQDKMQSLNNLMSKRSVLYKIRYFIETTFPVVLGILSIMCAIISIYK